ncbi:hypothetical protein [Breznakiella homolactica]|uniref:Uncharacterized protein n=1 Tax=Breznakiella homolactica TaxID=2798577 RepID=A0A7T8BD00_9SPIR|nr:hypothetical protein [Breznakiella homolactica]QQO10758.1 hypothetical protein JFL75_07535 [Breznakiella homolactica]
MDSTTIFNRLVQVLCLLSSSYEIQKSALPANIVLADELALLFDDVFIFCERLQKEKFISSEQFSLLKQLDTVFNEMSAIKEIWSDSALEKEKDWDGIREKASLLLKNLGQDYTLPSIDWVTFIF